MDFDILTICALLISLGLLWLTNKQFKSTENATKAQIEQLELSRKVAEEQIEHNRILTKTSITLNMSSDTSDKKVGIFIENSGPGIAKVKNVRFFYRNLEYKSWPEILKKAHDDSLIFIDEGTGYSTSFPHKGGTYIIVGMKRWLISFNSKLITSHLFLEEFLSRVDIDFEYETITGEKFKFGNRETK